MNDLRRFIDIVETQPQQLDERGGMIDKMLSSMSGLPGILGTIGSRAGAKVTEKEIYKAVKDLWIKQAFHDKVDEKDVEALKMFLKNKFGLTDESFQKIEGLNGPVADVKKALMGVSSVLASQGVSAGGGGKGKKGKGARVASQKQKIDPKVRKHFSKKLQGDFNKLGAEAREVNGKTASLRGKPLALMGYLVLRNYGMAK